MLGAAIIVFREVLEAALIVGIVLAASTGVPRRGFWISTGLAGGVVGAGARRCCSPREIAAAAAGIGQELLNAAILLLAVGDARLAQHLDVAPWPRARRDRPAKSAMQ